MTFIYGLPAVEVTNPDGEVVVYLLRQVVPEAGEKRAYVLVKPSGEEERCADRGGGHWQCTCPAFVFKDRYDMAKQGRCKHIRGVVEAVEPAKEQEPELVGAA